MAVLRAIFPVLLLGIVVPLWKGLDFLDSGLLMLYGCVPLLLSPAVAHGRNEMLRAAIVTAAIPPVSILFAFSLLASRNELRWLPRATVLATVIVLSAATAMFGVALKARLARTMGIAGARRAVLAVIAVLMVLYMSGWLIPAEWTTTESLVRMALVSSGILVALAYLLVQ